MLLSGLVLMLIIFGFFEGFLKEVGGGEEKKDTRGEAGAGWA